MKNIWKYVLILYCTSSSAQITLENIVSTQVGIGMDFYTVQISLNETKYVFCDSVSNTFSLYNMDFTPFITNISVPEPFQMLTIGYQPIYITRSLFDCDSSNIEYAYEAPSNANRAFYIMRTDGTQLFRLDSANGPFCAGGCLGFSDVIQPIKNTSAGAKLFLQRPYVAYQGKIFIFSLCGTLPESVFDLSLQNSSYVTVFPNPSSTALTFRISLPDNMNEYELVIIDNNAREVSREKIKSPYHEYIMNANNLSDGTFYFSLCTKSKSYQSGKFIISK